jgi:hypothetical protein
MEMWTGYGRDVGYSTVFGKLQFMTYVNACVLNAN